MFNFDKKSLSLSPTTPFLHPTTQTCLFMLRACILFGGTEGLPENPISLTVGTCGKHITPLSGTAGHTESCPPPPSSPLPLAVTCLQPSSFVRVKSSPIAPRCQGPSRRTDGQQPQVHRIPTQDAFPGTLLPSPRSAASESREALPLPLRPA